MKISIADLSERIILIRYDTTRNEYGDIVKVEEIQRCEVWAKIYPLTARINDATPESASRITYRVTIRYRTDILPDDEILWRGRHLKLLSPPYPFEGKRKFICMDCAEVIGDGRAKESL